MICTATVVPCGEVIPWFVGPCEEVVEDRMFPVLVSPLVTGVKVLVGRMLLILVVVTHVKVLGLGTTEEVLVGASDTSFSIFQWKVELQPVTYRLEHTPDMDDIAPYKQLAMQGAKQAALLSKGRTEVELGSDQASRVCYEAAI